MRTKIVASLVALLALLGCERHRESPAFKIDVSIADVENENRKTIVEWLVDTGERNDYAKVASPKMWEDSIYDVSVNYILFPEKAWGPNFSPRASVTKVKGEKELSAYFYCGSIFSEQERFKHMERLANNYVKALNDRWPNLTISFYILTKSGYEERPIKEVISEGKVIGLRNQIGECSNIKTSN